MSREIFLLQKNSPGHSRGRGSAFDVVIHVHEVVDAGGVVGNIGVTPDGVLQNTAGHGEVDHVHGLVVMNHGVDQAAGKGVAAADPVENVEREELTLECVPLIPHEGFEAARAAAPSSEDFPEQSTAPEGFGAADPEIGLEMANGVPAAAAAWAAAVPDGEWDGAEYSDGVITTSPSP